MKFNRTFHCSVTSSESMARKKLIELMTGLQLFSLHSLGDCYLEISCKKMIVKLKVQNMHLPFQSFLLLIAGNGLFTLDYYLG